MDQRIRYSFVRVAIVLVCFLAPSIGNFAVKPLAAQPPTSSPTSDDDAKFTAEQLEFFESKIRPLLVEHCFECHSGEHTEGELRVDSRPALLSGGSTGPAVVPGKPEESLLIEAINYEGAYEMPPSNKLKKADIKLLTEWVAQGAPWPKSDSASANPNRNQFDLASRKTEHWCWQAIRSAQNLPQVGVEFQAADHIDQWVEHYRRQQQLQTAARATPLERLRRVYFDLIGLPPPLEVVQRVQADGSDQQYEQIVDELLASPQFGERWARHWMDLTRYAETYGHEFDYPIEDAYHYRDYLIRAFNADVPYNQFVQEHIAGDLLPTPRRHPDQRFIESVIGTGFWYFHEATHGPVDVRGDEAGHIDNRIDVLGKTFLGLTISCARCHDHKFDAISSEDFYALAGFLQSSRKQRAMLDPQEKIAASAAQAKQHQQALQQALKSWGTAAQAVDLQNAPLPLGHAVQFLRQHPRPQPPAPQTIQGEAMTWTQPKSGQVMKQRIGPQPGFAWQGDEQVWWLDGKPGETLELAFDVAHGGRQQLALVLTKAVDYGIVKVFWNDQPLGNPIDCFAEKLTTSGEVPLGTIDVAPGRQTLKLEIVGANPRAVARYMVGLDYIALSPDAAQPTLAQWQSDLAQYADEHQISTEHLSAWVSWLLDQPRLTKPSAFDLIYQLLDQPAAAAAEIVGTWKANLERQVSEQRAASETAIQSWRGDASRRQFAEFSTGLDGWFITGEAFSWLAPNQKILAPDGKLVLGPLATSRTLGDGYYGVLRSPTFDITHPQVHLRLRGKNVQLRLIIDGYHLDTFNALLFEGLTITIPESEQFQWVTIGGDLRNFLGHRAHLEVIDHGHGYVDLAEIWFGTSPPPNDTAELNFAHRLAEQLPAISSETFDLVACINELSQQMIADAATMAATSEPASQTWDLATILERLIAAPWDAVPPSNPSPTTPVAIWPSQTRRPDNDSIVAGGNHTDHSLSSAAAVESWAKLAERSRELRDQLVRASEHAHQAPAPLFVIGMTDGTPENEFLFVRGNHQALGPQVSRRDLTALLPENHDSWNQLSTSGRKELAERWTSSENPLVSRVIVNRLWGHLFGRGIVESVDNFGVLGSKPTHPELLDQLALDFMADGWSIKRMIRRMVLSQTYQLSSRPTSTSTAKDPDNRWLHCRSIKRLEGEAIRDAILATSGRLDLTQFGPSVPIHLTPFMQGRGRPGHSGPLDGNGRRSIYLEVRRNFLHPMFLAFDTPIPFNSVGRRNVSNVPAQALILMNDPFVSEQSQLWANQALAKTADPVHRIEHMFLTALSRPVTADELAACEQFLKEQTVAIGQPEETWSTNVTAWRDLAHVIFNLKSFTFVQ